jgi:glycosyltransferase involved in cell wall biosynthesis
VSQTEKKGGSRKTRVAIVKHCYFPSHPHIKKDADTLTKNGFEVDVYCCRAKNSKPVEIVDGITVYRLPGEIRREGLSRYIFEYTNFMFLVALKLIQNSLKRRYDVIEVDTMPDHLVFCTLIPKIFGTRVILYMFENMAELFRSSFKKGTKHFFIRVILFFEKISAGYADRVISADGHYYKQILVSHGIRENKVSVVQNVPNVDTFPINISPPKKDGFFHVVTHGSVIRRYGIQVLIRAVPVLLKEIPNLRVDVVGDGEYLPEVKKLADSLGINEFVRFTGMVPHKEVPSYLTQAHVGVAPMIDDVGIPNKVFEYFALQRPVVLSSHPSLRATFSADSVSYFEPDNENDLAQKIIALYRNPEKAAEQVLHGTEFYHKNQWPVMKHEYLKVYEELLSK